MAAAVMDFQHVGRDGFFHVRVKDERAVMFNDQHVPENYSLVCALELLRNQRLDFLEGSIMKPEDTRLVGHHAKIRRA
jgi:hypothetical protein